MRKDIGDNTLLAVMATLIAIVFIFTVGLIAYYNISLEELQVQQNRIDYQQSELDFTKRVYNAQMKAE